MDTQQLKRFTQLGAAALISLCFTSAAFASDADEKLTADNTTSILQKVNDLPTYLSAISQYVIAWMEPDTSDATAAMQTNFTQLNNIFLQNMTAQNTLQQQLNADLLEGVTKANFPSANDLVYSSMLGTPVYTPDPRGSSVVPQYNYIKNASGLTISNVLPNPAWHGSPEAQKRYIHYYNTMMAIKSYGAYILSNQYADGKQISDQQAILIAQASDPTNWFAKIASENIGWVLRQILMYQSQSYVLLSQLVQTQRQMVAAQVMTNAAVVATASLGDQMIIKSAQSP